MTWSPDSERGRVREIRQLGDPVLRTSATTVTRFDDKLRQLIDDMFASMYAAEGVGLAANQIGVELDVFVYDCPPDDDRVEPGQPDTATAPDHGIGYLINPTLERVWGETLTWDEGCLSLKGLTEPTERSDCAAVTGVDIEGAPVRVIGSGLLGRCLQHETDHLRGMVYLDRVPRLRRARAIRRLQKLREADSAPSPSGSAFRAR